MSFNDSLKDQHKIFRIIDVLFRHKWAIIITFFVVVSVVTIYTVRQPKIYSATSSVMIKDQLTAKLGFGDFSGTKDRNMKNELEILNSNKFYSGVAERIIDRFYVDPENRKDTIRMLKDAARLVGYSDTNHTAARDYIAERLPQFISYEIGKENDVVKITASSLNPAEAAMLSNIVAESYLDKDLVNNRSNASQVRKFLEEQQNNYRDELEKSERMFQIFSSTEGVASLSDESRNLIQKITELQTELERSDIEYQKGKLLLENYSKDLNRIVPQATERILDVDDLYIQQLRQKISELEADKDILKIASSNSSSRPEYQKELLRKQREIDSLKSILSVRSSKYISNSLEDYTLGSGANKKGGDAVSSLSGEIYNLQLKQKTLELNRNMLYKQLAKYEAQFSRLPQQSYNLAKLMRDKEINEKLYKKIGEQYQEALLAEKSIFGKVELLDYAKVPSGPVSPRIALNIALSMVIGLLLGITAAFTLNFVFNYVRNPQDIEALGFRLISTIPKLRLGDGSEEKKMLPGSIKGLLNAKGDYSVATESYQRLQIYLDYAFQDRKIQSLLVTSSGPGEGKSATASNLAITYANSGKKVLLVDCDLRKPSINKYFNLHPVPSLSHYLFGKNSLEDVLRDTHVDGLKVITAIEFRQNPALILTSEKMYSFMSEMSKRFDLVIYDTPPVNAVTDAIHLAKKVDDVILIARAEKTNIDEINRAANLFREFHISIGGVVLNDFDDSKLNSYYGRYYGYYSQDEASRKGKVNKRSKIILKANKFTESEEFKSLNNDADEAFYNESGINGKSHTPGNGKSAIHEPELKD